MDKQVLSSFQFKDYKINEFTFRRNDDFTYDEKVDVNFKFDSEAKVDSDNKTAIVSLDITVCNPDEFEKYPFTMFVSISGLFEYESDEPIDSQTFLDKCKLYGTTALFPFVRSAVSDITRISNVPPMILPLINVYSYLGLE